MVALYQDLPKISIGLRYCYPASISSSKRYFLRSWNRGRRAGQPVSFSFHAIFFSLIFRCAGTGAEPEAAVENTRGKRSDPAEILSSNGRNSVRSFVRTEYNKRLLLFLIVELWLNEIRGIVLRCFCFEIFPTWRVYISVYIALRLLRLSILINITYIQKPRYSP